MLVIPSTRRLSLGEAQWLRHVHGTNCRVIYQECALALTTFRRELKTVLFRWTFDDDWAIVILHSITVSPRLPTFGASDFLFNSVRCPCSVLSHDSVTLVSTFLLTYR